MMQSQSLSQSEIDQLLKNCDYFNHLILPKEYQKIMDDSNIKILSEWLTGYFDKPSSQHQQQIQVAAMSTKVFHLRRIMVSQGKNLIKICVEIFYFLFTCLNKNIFIEFMEQLIIYDQTQAKFMFVVKEIKHTKPGYKLKQKEYYTLYIEALDKLVQLLQSCLRSLLQHTFSPSLQLPYSSQPYSYPQLSISHFQIFQKHSHKILQQHSLSDVDSFKQLQKHQLIYQNSIIKKISNCSLNLFLYRFAGQEVKGKLVDALKKENKLVRMYADVGRKGVGSQGKLGQLQNEIEGNFQKYVQGLTGNPVFVKLNPPPIIDPNQQPYPYKFKLKFKPRPQPNNPKPQHFQYHISYIPAHPLSQFPSLTVRLNTTYTLQPLSSDYILQKLNTIAYNTNFITIETTQVQVSTESKKNKYIVLKTNSKIVCGSSIIRHFVRLVDMVMAVYQVVEAEVGEHIREFGKMMEKGEIGIEGGYQISQQIDHYCCLVASLADNYYQNAIQ